MVDFEGLIKKDDRPSFTSDLLEQYKLYVQSAENVSTRRVASSRYLLTLNTALAALCFSIQATNFSQDFRLGIPIMGIFASCLWFQIIKSHRDLNAAKFKIIHEIEKYLPIALYEYEWRIVGQGKSKAYKSTTRIEQYIPVGFLVLFIVLTVLGFCERPEVIE